MNILLFQDLERLRQTGNFSQAAALSNVSQPAFSRRINTLEGWVGAPLVDRSHQPVRLTPAGEQILEAGLQALSRIETERSQIREAQSLPDKYIVTFAAQHSIGWRFYPEWLQALEQGYGPLLSRLRADDLPSCLHDLRNGGVDFVIAYGSDATSLAGPYTSITIGKDALIPVCRPDADGRPVFGFEDPDVRMPFLRFGETAPISAHLAPLFAREGLSERMRTVYENAMAGALRMRARAGDGVAWLPRSLVKPDLESGFLVRTGEPDWEVELTVRLVRGPENLNHVTRALWAFLEERQETPLLSAHAPAPSPEDAGTPTPQ